MGISSCQEEKHVYFSIRDNGTGWPPDVLYSTFKPFFVGDRYHLSRKYGRIGQGPPIAKKLADLLGDEISFERENKKGSTFTLILSTNPSGMPTPAHESADEFHPITGL